MPRISEGSFEVMKDDVGEQPVAKEQVVDGPAHTLLILVGQQAAIEDGHHSAGKAHH